MADLNMARMLGEHGFACRGVQRVPTGLFNQTFVCEVDGAPGTPWVVVRVAPPDDAGFLFYERRMMAQEPSIHQLLLDSTDVPVPRILVYDNTRAVCPQDFLIMEYMAGTPISSAGLGGAQREHAVRSTGAFLRQVHDRCRAERYGYLGEHHCMKPQPDWGSAFRVMWRALIEDIAGCGVYAADDMDDALQVWKTHESIFDRRVPSSLLHMDIWDQNILVDRAGTVTAVLDWDRALWGDPEIEFAVLDYCGYNTPAFWDGYGAEPDRSPEARTRAAFYHLYEVQKYLVIWTLRGGGGGRVEAHKRYTLDLLRKLRHT